MLTFLRRASFRVWYHAWRSLSGQFRNRALPINGVMTLPYPGQPYIHSLQMRGWFASADVGPIDLSFVLGSRAIASVRCDALQDTNERREFNVQAEPKDLRDVGTGLLRVLARTSDGQTSCIAIGFVRRVSAVPSAMSRSEYGRVWDSVSRNRKQARISVAGYSDDAEWQRSGASTADYIAATLRLTAQDRVLEIGCGTGRVGAQLAPRSGAWVGADVSRNMLNFAKEELRQFTNVSFVQLNGYNLDGLQLNSYDAIYCTAVFMHLDEWDRYRYVKEALALLRPGGRAFFDNYNLLGEAGWKFFEETSLLDVAVRPPNVSRSSTPEELRQYLTRAGYTDIRTEEGSLFVTALGSRPI